MISQFSNNGFGWKALQRISGFLRNSHFFGFGSQISFYMTDSKHRSVVLEMPLLWSCRFSLRACNKTSCKCWIGTVHWMCSSYFLIWYESHSICQSIFIILSKQQISVWAEMCTAWRIINSRVTKETCLTLIRHAAIYASWDGYQNGNSKSLLFLFLASNKLFPGAVDGVKYVSLVFDRMQPYVDQLSTLCLDSSHESTCK